VGILKKRRRNSGDLEKKGGDSKRGEDGGER